MSFGRALGVGLGAMFALRIVQFAAFALYHFVGEGRNLFAGDATAILILLGTAALQVGVVFGMCKLVGRSVADLGWGARPSAGALALSGGGFVLIVASMLIPLALFGMGPAEIAAQVAGYSPGQRVSFVIIGCLAAFVEESVFRGHLQPLLADKLGKVQGVVLVAVIFDLYHLQFHPFSLVGKLISGLVLGGIFARTGTLFASALAHAPIWWVLGAL